MSAVLPHPDQRTIDRLRAGDESALEQLFRDSYPALTEEAAAELGDAAFAPRVVERAMLDTWAERAKVSDPESLEALLHRTVQHEALREKSRRAALRRFESHEGNGGTTARHARAHAMPASADEAWRELSARIHSVERPHDEAHQRQAAVARHEAAEHIAHVGDESGSRRLVLWAVALAVLAGVGYLLLRPWLERMNEPARIARAVAAKDAEAIIGRSGAQALVTLRDGSRVTLAPGSRLLVAKSFDADRRWTGLEGSMSVASTGTADQPLMIVAGPALVSATGALDLAAWPGQDVVLRARDETARVRVGESTRDLAAGEALVVTTAGSTFVPDRAMLDAALGWLDGTLTLRDTPFRDVVPVLERWYGMQLSIEDASLLDRRVSLSVPLGDVRSLLAALERDAGIRVGWREGVRVATDAR